MYKSITNQIEIKVECEYVATSSLEMIACYAWVYYIRIKNLSDEKIQLISRNWKIFDGIGRQYNVSGAGVIGKQPILESGEKFSYSSAVNLSTSSGVMSGSYDMIMIKDRKEFLVNIPPFCLDVPGVAYLLN